MDKSLIYIPNLPVEHQQPFNNWLFEMGKTQCIIDEQEPRAYAWPVDYAEWRAAVASRKNHIT